MKKLSILILSIMFLGGFISIFLPDVKPHLNKLTSEQLIYEINKNHYFTTDEIARAIMTKDPSVLLIDVRSPEEYAKFTLPGALNIPADSVLNDQYKGYFSSDAYKMVFFSNGSLLAEKAWIMCKDLHYDNVFVMKGGLNKWFSTIIRPERPQDWEDGDAFELYEFRKAASAFFGGGTSVGEEENPTPAPQVQVPAVNNKNNEVSGGCE